MNIEVDHSNKKKLTVALDCIYKTNLLNFPVWTSAILERCFNSSVVACTADKDSSSEAL